MSQREFAKGWWMTFLAICILLTLWRLECGVVLAMLVGITRGLVLPITPVKSEDKVTPRDFITGIGCSALVLASAFFGFGVIVVWVSNRLKCQPISAIGLPPIAYWAVSILTAWARFGLSQRFKIER